MEGWIVGYLMTIYQLHQFLSVERYDNMIAFGKFEEIGKDAMVAYFKALFVHLLGENVEDHRKLRLVGVPVQL
jgi:hypothetical protein